MQPVRVLLRVLLIAGRVVSARPLLQWMMMRMLLLRRMLLPGMVTVPVRVRVCVRVCLGVESAGGYAQATLQRRDHRRGATQNGRNRFRCARTHDGVRTFKFKTRGARSGEMRRRRAAGWGEARTRV